MTVGALSAVPTLTAPDTSILVALAAPNTGVTNVGLVANTAEPLPVSSVSAVARLEELKEPNVVAVPTDVIAPVKFGILVVDDAVPVSEPTKLDAVTIPADAIIPDALMVTPLPTTTLVVIATLFGSPI